MRKPSPCCKASFSTTDSDAFFWCRRDATTMPTIPQLTTIRSATADAACQQYEKAIPKGHGISYMRCVPRSSTLRWVGRVRICSQPLRSDHTGRGQGACQIDANDQCDSGQPAHRSLLTACYHIRRPSLSAAFAGTTTLCRRVGRSGTLRPKTGCVSRRAVICR